MLIFILTFAVDCQGVNYDALKAVTLDNKVVIAWAKQYVDYGTMKIQLFDHAGDCLRDVNLAETVKQEKIIMDNWHTVSD